MSKKDLKIPEHMKNESVETLNEIRKNGYDYKKVERSLNEATKSMLDNSNRLLNPRVVNVVPNTNFTLILTFFKSRNKNF